MSHLPRKVPPSPRSVAVAQPSSVPSPRGGEKEGDKSPRGADGKEELKSPRDGQPALEKKKSVAASTLANLQSRTKTIVNKAANKINKARKSGIMEVDAEDGPQRYEELSSAPSSSNTLPMPTDNASGSPDEVFPPPGPVATVPGSSPRKSPSRDSSGSIPLTAGGSRKHSQDYSASPQLPAKPSSSGLPSLRSTGQTPKDPLTGEAAGDYVPSLDGRGYDLHKTLKLPPNFVNQFALPDSDENLVFAAPNAESNERRIKGGTLAKLVERLTYHEHADPEYAKMFLLTYRSFTTPVELMNLLTNRFMCPIEDEDEHDDPETRRAKQKPVRLRVFAVLNMWVSQAYDFSDENDELVRMLKAFSKNYLEPIMPSGARQLQALLEKALSHEELTKKRTPISSKDMPRPFLPTCRPSELGLLTIHPQEIARQLTLMEFELFQAIKPWELLNLAWSRKGKEEKAPNVLAMIARSNVISPWLAHQIVSNKSLKMRAELVTRCIQCMVYLEDLHNYNGLMEFIAALQNAGVYRLRDTFARIDKKWKRSYDMICDRMSPDRNFANFRDSLRNVSPPSIPFLGLYLQDLTFLEEGNPDFLDEERGIINMQKRFQWSQTICDIQLYQQTPYLLQSVPLVQDFLRGLEQYDSEALYDASLAIKARAADSRELDEGSAADAVKPKPKAEAAEALQDWGEMNFPPNYPFAEPDSDDNIVLGEENNRVVLYATTAKLVERLTFEKYSDQTFVSAFLLTYHFMMTSKELLTLLFQRYDVPLPKRDDADTRAKYEAKVVRPVRLRVFNALKQWVDKYPQDFADPEVSKMLEQWAEDTMKTTGMAKSAERLIEGLQAAHQHGSGSHLKTAAAAASVPASSPGGALRRGAGNKQPPAIIYPSRVANIMEATIWDLSPVELARQITLMEFALYHRIGDREVLMWSPTESHPQVDREKNSPNALALDTHNKWLVNWTIALVVHQPEGVTSATMSKCLEHLIALAEALRALNNFNGCRCVVEGLMCPALVPLDAWVSLSSKSAKTFDALKDFCRELKTYVSHQQWLQKVSVPMLPSLQSCLDEMHRVEMSLPDKISEMIHPEKLWHVEKKLKQHKIVTDFLVFQGSEFLLDESKELVAIITAVPPAPETDKLAEVCERLNAAVEEADAAALEAAAAAAAGRDESSLKARMKEAVTQLKTGKSNKPSSQQLRLVSNSNLSTTNSPVLSKVRGREERSGSVATGAAPALGIPGHDDVPNAGTSPSDESQSPRKVESPRKMLQTSPRRVSAALSASAGIGYDKRESDRRASKEVVVRAAPEATPVSRASPVPTADSPRGVSREWVQEAIRAAVEEAVQPLRAEIASLKAQLTSLKAMLDTGEDEVEQQHEQSSEDPFA